MVSGWDTRLRRLDPRVVALAFAAVASVAFLVTEPPVGDFWAARARQSAVAHGVGLQYWFSWFGGIVPGNYSVLTPYLSRFIDAALLGAASTLLVTALSYVLLRGSRHAVAGTWLAAVGSSVSLWSGRVPFAFGTVLMLIALLLVRRERRWAAGAAGALTALVSPVSAAFLILGLSGVALHDRQRRVSALAAAATSGACLLGVALYFGMPGPENFPALSAFGATAAIAALLLAKPPAYIRTVLLISLVACPLLAIIPNGMGSNFERFAWICLPVATVATAQAQARRAIGLGAAALSLSLIGSGHDLYVAAQPMSTDAYYQGLIGQLDRTSGLADYRVEVVPDGTHVAAYALLDHATLARGFETQADNAYNKVLESPTLNARTFRAWLDTNAVGYVALDHRTLNPSPEDKLVRAGRLPYLRRVWSDANWQLFAVTHPTPIVAAPAEVVAADQASLTLATPKPGQLGVRIRWSRFLQVQGPAGTPAQLQPDGKGWTILLAPRAGDYVVTG